jgi:hypothetical protein
MNAKSHEATTAKAFDMLAQLDAELAGWFCRAKGLVTGLTSFADISNEVELVDVEGGLDDPHADEGVLVNDDVAKWEEEGKNYTAFNHFIDIKKGPGQFDDFDGYSYAKGSGSVDQFQDALEEADAWYAKAAAWITGMKVDQGIAFWLNDEYVHAPGHPWYRYGLCSRGLEHYSYYQDKGLFSSLEAECCVRFPLAASTGHEGLGFPYSVFMPVDNLARYWYTEYCRDFSPGRLGPVMHAVQDASVPHHAAGYNGNWHGRYERALDLSIEGCLDQGAALASQLYQEFSADDPEPPTALAPSGWHRTPRRNWRVDMLVTWVALNAYRSYDQVYGHFREGYSFSLSDAETLTAKALAVCMLILKNAARAPYDALVTDPSLRNSVTTAGLALPWSWRAEWSAYPPDLHAVLCLLNSAYPEYVKLPVE